ncbi:MAG TPA: glycosyltransferase family 2 protein [Stellaceae bacterium]|nr:glycosyltransferase family 2 protein [Stellaceae bacterium]
MTIAPTVSIIMANYNGARYLPAAIRSVIRQTLRSWELILVDDASTDNSVAAANEAGAGDPRITIVVQSKNQGPAAARNRALAMAKGQWIAIVDSDDVMLPQRLELLLQRAEADSAAIIADNLLVFSETSRPRPFLSDRLSRAPCWVGLGEFIDSNCLYSRTPDLGYLKPVIRAELIRALMLRYDESLRIGEDYNFLVRLMAQGHRLRLEPTSLYLYRKHEGSISHRLRAADIFGLIAAERRFSEHARALGPDVIAALKRRRRSLESLAIYDDVIATIKRGDLVRAARRASLNPHMWPLLTRPISARLKRLGKKSALSMRRFRPQPDDEAELSGMLLQD